MSKAEYLDRRNDEVLSAANETFGGSAEAAQEHFDAEALKTYAVEHCVGVYLDNLGFFERLNYVKVDRVVSEMRRGYGS